MCPIHKKQQVLPGKKRCHICRDSQLRGYANHMARQQAAGRCSCGGERVVGFRKCARCRERERVYSELSKLTGLCSCGKNLPEYGRKGCKSCNDKAAARRLRKRQTGKCQCGRELITGKVCSFCKQLNLAVQNRNKQAGLCHCGKPPTPGYSSCAPCRSQAMRRYAIRRQDDSFVAKMKLRGAIVYGIIRSKGTKKAQGTETLLGCTIAFARKHIEQQFPKGMTWQNRELWHIDHYVPCDAFDLSDPRQQRLCNNWRNLRPLWEKDNLTKGSKFPADYKQRIAELEAHVP